ncbi:hypothetical protein [Phaeovulum sp.]|uniref:hypothetical protein n=1 Tax=Phaeovulum sp. TaxID=2934796 RepID=UPI0039E2C68C
MLRLLSAALILSLAACGTPQERCINTATRELHTIERLLSEVEGNLARGYAWEEYEITRSHWVRCGPIVPSHVDKNGKHITPRPRMCLEDYTDTLRRRVAIDPASEKRKRDGLIAKRAELTRTAKAQIAQCQALYPE